MCKLQWVLHSFTHVITKSKQNTLLKKIHSSTTAFVCALTSSGTPELCVSLFPSVIVMITDGSRKKGLRPCVWKHSAIKCKFRKTVTPFILSSLLSFLYLPDQKHCSGLCVQPSPSLLRPASEL